MALKYQIHTEPLSEKTGEKIINLDNISILELDKQALLDLYKSSGVLLFRGFETDLSTFTQFSNSLGRDFLDYSGGSINRRVIDKENNVLSVNSFKEEIKLHGEMYYQKNTPLMLWFFCATPPLENGETIICDGQQFFNEMSDSLKDIFEQKKIKYAVQINQEDWQERYQTKDFELVKKIFQNNYTRVQVNEDQSIDLEYICPAIYPSGSAKRPTFIGNLLSTKKINPKLVNFEDDSEITDEMMSELYEIGEKLTIDIAWQKGDILMIDNTQIMHGRRSATDEQRDIYIRLCSPAFPLAYYNMF